MELWPELEKWAGCLRGCDSSQEHGFVIGRPGFEISFLPVCWLDDPGACRSPLEPWFPRWLNKCVVITQQLTCEFKMLCEPRPRQGAFSLVEKLRSSNGPHSCGRSNVCVGNSLSLGVLCRRGATTFALLSTVHVWVSSDVDSEMRIQV